MNEVAEPDHSVIAACINKRQLPLRRAARALAMSGRSILIRPPKERATEGGQRGSGSVAECFLGRRGCGAALYAVAGEGPRGAVA